MVQDSEAAVKERPLEVATAATGGLYRSTVKDASIEKAIDDIGGELHAQYTLSYRPTGTYPSGYHEIRVQVVDRRALAVRARPGYYLGAPGALTVAKASAFLTLPPSTTSPSLFPFFL